MMKINIFYFDFLDKGLEKEDSVLLYILLSIKVECSNTEGISILGAFLLLSSHL